MAGLLLVGSLFPGLAVADSLATPSSCPENAACESPTSEDRLPDGTAALLADTIRIVAAYEAAGWFLDEVVLDEAGSVLLESVCRATPAARQAALRRTAQRRLGDPVAQYRRAGNRMTDGVRLALTRDREWRLLQRSMARAARQCPFWVRPSSAFEGWQTVRNQWVLHLEGGGIGQVRLQDDEFVVGAGGNGRLLVGRGIEDHFSVLFGGELGGGALLTSSDQGQFTINYFPALPLVVRYRDVAWLYDFEVAPVALFQSDDTRLSYGGRVGGGIGLSVLRTRDFLPWAGVAVSFEHYVASGGRTEAQFLRAGVRVGVRWLP